MEPQNNFAYKYNLCLILYTYQVSEKFFYICCFFVHGSSYISPNTFGIMHRLHHMHTDTDGDPHSPSGHPSFFGTMWQTRNSYYNIFCGKTVVDKKLKKDLPHWDSFEKRKSTKSLAAAGCGGRPATLIVSRTNTTGSSGTHSIGARLLM